MATLCLGEELIFRVAIPIPVYSLFDYLAPANIELDSLEPGMRLEVPFGKGKKIAFLIEITQKITLINYINEYKQYSLNKMFIFYENIWAEFNRIMLRI